MSQSATPATQNDMSTSCDTSKRTRFCDFFHRHGNFHTSQRQNQRFPTSFLIGDVSCEASVDFHDMLQNATPATEFEPCHHFAQRWHCNAQKTRNTTRPKYCACHAKWHRRCPKCCTCHEKCNTSSENVAKVLRLPHKTIFDASWHMLKCHEVPRLQRKTTLLWHVKKVTFLRLFPSSRKLCAHDGLAQRFLLTHVECHEVPRLPRKTTWPQLLTRQKSHVFATVPIVTETLRRRRSRTEIPPHTRGMSRSATPATKNDMTTAFLTRQKSHVFATVPIVTETLRPRRSQTDGCKRLQMVANGFERLRTPKAGSREHRSTPRSPNVKREPFATHSGKKGHPGTNSLERSLGYSILGTKGWGFKNPKVLYTCTGSAPWCGWNLRVWYSYNCLDLGISQNFATTDS